MFGQRTISCELTRDDVVVSGVYGWGAASNSVLFRPSSSLSASKLLLTQTFHLLHQIVYASFLAQREPHVVTIDPQPPSTSPARDLVPNHHRNSHSSAQCESAISSLSTNVSPSERSHTTGTSPLVPATRPRSELEGENRIDALPQLPEICSCAPFACCGRYCFDA